MSISRLVALHRCIRLAPSDEQGSRISLLTGRGEEEGDEPVDPSDVFRTEGGVVRFAGMRRVDPRDSEIV